jgi:GTPase SAR1 family protein
VGLAREYGGTDLPLILVANKTDLVSERVISSEEGLNKAKKIGTTFFETSAKGNNNIKELMNHIATSLAGKE